LIRRNSALRGVAATESSKGYAPATIIGAIRGIGQDGGRAILEDAGGRYLTRQDVKNAGHAWRTANPDVRIAKPNPQWQELVLEAIETLEKAGYEAISIDSLDQNGDLAMGLVFAHPARLQVLTRRGWSPLPLFLRSLTLLRLFDAHGLHTQNERLKVASV